MNTDKIIAEAIAKDYAPKYYLDGINAISFEWVKDGCKKSIDEVSKIIDICIFGLNNKH